MSSQAAAANETFPKFTGNVVDTVHALPADRAAELTEKLQSFQTRSGRQLVVVTLPYDPNRDIDDYGYRLGRTWGVGLRDVNNGVILLVVPFGPVGHRDVRIEVGYGLEPILTDAFSGTIVRNVMLPAFKAGDIPGGIEKGVDAIIQQLSLPDDQAKARQDAAVAAWNKQHARHRNDGSGAALVFWAIVIGVILLSSLRRSRRHGPWAGSSYGGSNWPIVLWSLMEGLESSRRGGGSGWTSGIGSDSGGSDGGWTGGGFTGGGGGSFGGGGASGSW